MKKILALIFILLISFSLFAWKELDNLRTNQSILAYINGVLELEISPFNYANLNGGKGINLNINDDTNNFRYLIAPTQTPNSVPGLLVGSYSLISSSSDYKLTITHDKLVKTTDSSIQYDYELCTIYSVLIGSTMVERTAYSTATPHSIEINFNETHGILMLQNAGLYFRLSTEVHDSGQYQSTVTLILESLT